MVEELSCYHSKMSLFFAHQKLTLPIGWWVLLFKPRIASPYCTRRFYLFSTDIFTYILHGNVQYSILCVKFHLCQKNILILIQSIDIMIEDEPFVIVSIYAFYWKTISCPGEGSVPLIPFLGYATVPVHNLWINYH